MDAVNRLQSGFWTDVIDLCFWEGYGVHDFDITGTDKGDKESEWFANFCLVEKDVCPFSQDSLGVMAGAVEGSLVYASMNMRTGELHTTLPTSRQLDLPHKSVLDAMSYSSGFWSASIMESKAQYFFLRNILTTAKVESRADDDSYSSSSTTSTVYLGDGGLIDTTGIVTLLQKGVTRIVAFYNNNNPLSSLQSPIASLFGVETKTDSMNSIQG